MDFEKDIVILKKAIGKDTEIFIEIFNNLKEKYPDKQKLIIDIVEQELAERNKRIEAFIEEATGILQLEEI